MEIGNNIFRRERNLWWQQLATHIAVVFDGFDISSMSYKYIPLFHFAITDLSHY